jgi:TPR repeat protein
MHTKTQHFASPILRTNSFQANSFLVKNFLAISLLAVGLCISSMTRAGDSLATTTTDTAKVNKQQATEKLITPELQDGQAAFNTGNYDLAFSLWQTRATQGHSDAQVFVGLSYANGWGVDKNTKLAGHWYQKAAKNDNASGQFLLGIYLISGRDANLPKGVMWLRRAAENGDTSAKGFLKKAKRHGWFDKVPQIKKENRRKVETVALAGSIQ